MGAASVAMQAASSVGGAFGDVAQGFAQANSDKYNAAVAMMNASQASKNAGMVAEAGESQSGIQSMRTRAELGGIKANQGASGVDVNTGSSAGTQISADELGKLDAMTIRSNAAKEAYGYQVQSANFKNEAAQDRLAASKALTAGWVSGAGTLLGGATQGATDWMKYKDQGALGFGLDESPQGTGVMSNFGIGI